MDLGSWLQNLGLGKYEPTFVENAIDHDVLPQLVEHDLEKIGIPLGDRKRLMRAINALIAGFPPEMTSRENAIKTKGAERRHLTVMICDLVGSTALTARLDPEDMGAVMDAYHAVCARITLSYEGFLADFRGDGILAYFGYPQAHEDDAERTVRAGLEIISAVAQLETRAAEPLSVRIGVATGIVVVGDLGGEVRLRDHLVVGSPPNLAARLQTLVGPNTIVVAESTRRLLGDLFVLRDLGKHNLKGIGEAVNAWAVEGLAASRSRFEAVRTTGPADLVGRKAEMNFLIERQRLAWQGEGQIVLITGEPGIGKSRLAAALAEHVADQPHSQFHFQCSPYHTSSALRPIIEQLERAAGLKSDDAPETRLNKLEALLALGTRDVKDVAPFFAALLSVPFGDRYQQLKYSPAQQRRQTLAALLDQLEGHARKQPVLLVVEDAQWADDTSLELLGLIIERARQLPIIVLITSRPEFDPPWTGLANVGTLVLGRLSRESVEGITRRIVSGRSLPPEIMKQIVARTDGNPLFVEELTKVVLETGALVEDADGYRLSGPVPALAIPDTLQDSLMARLDRLHSVKEIAQVGAAIGREFPYTLIRAVVGGDENALKHALVELEQAELMYRQGELPDAVYRFKHALVRDAAYEGLLKRRRQQLHGQIAHTLEDKFPDVAISEPEILAHHFNEAGLADLATTYWLKAGNRALGSWANAEAVDHLKRGIELIQNQPASAERNRKELDFYLALGPAVAATEGDAAEETARVFSHARELLGDRGTLQEQMTIFWGVYLGHSMRAEHAAALDVTRRFAALGARHNHPGVSALASRFMGLTLQLMGNFVDSRTELEHTLELCAANSDTVATYRSFGVDDQTYALSLLAVTLLILGYPEQSATAWQQAETHARALNRSFTTALTFSSMTVLGTIGGDLQHALDIADEAIAICVESEFISLERRARFFRGTLFALTDHPQLGLETMERALASIEHNAETGRRTMYLCYLASAYGRLGQPDAAMSMLDEALPTVETTNERIFEAELHRVRGALLLGMGRKGEGEAELNRALTVARRQEARWWELRAAACLAKHLLSEGRYGEGLDVLQPVYDWFVEGLETAPDLIEARATLNQLKSLSAA